MFVAHPHRKWGKVRHIHNALGWHGHHPPMPLREKSEWTLLISSCSCASNAALKTVRSATVSIKKSSLTGFPSPLSTRARTVGRVTPSSEQLPFPSDQHRSAVLSQYECSERLPRYLLDGLFWPMPTPPPAYQRRTLLVPLPLRTCRTLAVTHQASGLATTRSSGGVVRLALWLARSPVDQ
jgi:hypothetical protein